MGPKVILGDSAHRDSYPSLYEGNHWDYHLSLFSSLIPLPFLIIPKWHSRRNPILGSKILHILRRVYQQANLPILRKGLKVLRRLKEESGVEEKKSIEKRKVYGKTKWKDLWRLTERRKFSSDRLLLFVRARVSWVSLQVQCISTKVKWMLKWDEWLIQAVFISRKKATSRKIPAQIPTKSSIVGSTSHRRTLEKYVKFAHVYPKTTHIGQAKIVSICIVAIVTV